jgi:hypothetical protein
MNREEIICMAREVGFEVLLPSEEVFGRGGVYTGSDDEISKYLERFASLVASAEREACAKLLEQAAEAAKNADSQGFVWQAVKASAEVIRARGQA